MTETSSAGNDNLKSILKTSPSPRRSQREVVFECVEIRYHAMELGDHPSVSIGAAVTLAWEAQSEAIFDVDEYELDRSRTRRPRLRLLILNYYQRLEILQRAGYSFDEITLASKQVTQVKRQREATQLMGPLNRVEEIGRSMRRLRCRYMRDRPTRKT